MSGRWYQSRRADNVIVTLLMASMCSAFGWGIYGAIQIGRWVF